MGSVAAAIRWPVVGEVVVPGRTDQEEETIGATFREPVAWSIAQAHRQTLCTVAVPATELHSPPWSPSTYQRLAEFLVLSRCESRRKFRNCLGVEWSRRQVAFITGCEETELDVLIWRSPPSHHRTDLVKNRNWFKDSPHLSLVSLQLCEQNGQGRSLELVIRALAACSSRSAYISDVAADECPSSTRAASNPCIFLIFVPKLCRS